MGYEEIAKQQFYIKNINFNEEEESGNLLDSIRTM